MAKKSQNITVNGVAVPRKKIGINEAIELLGWRDAKDGEVGYPYQGPNGKGKFVLEKNKSNRPFKPQLADQYKRQFLRGEWAGQWNSPSTTLNGETIIVDSLGGIVSLAHRGAGLILAELERQRLAAFREADPDSPAANKLKEYGCDGPIEIEVLQVEGVDPKSADTVDIGRTRTLGDVFFRRRELDGKEVTVKVAERLMRELAVAERLVWLRLNGKQVSRGRKGDIPEMVAFGQKHPLLQEALWHIYQLDGSSSKDGKKISSYISLAYAAALMYLTAFSESTRESFQEGTLDMSRKPKLWKQAAEFWALFAQDRHSEENAIESLHKVLERNRAKKSSKCVRDPLCMLAARAFQSWTGKADDWSTVAGLEKGLATKSTDVLRFGGLDLDRASLEALGAIGNDQPIVRTKSGDWKVGDSTKVVGSEYDPWLGTIESFTDNGTEARVVDKDGYYVDCTIEWLTPVVTKRRAA